MTWLRDFVKSFEETEPPERYFYWAGLAALSAIIGNKIYLDRFTYRLYPNLFIFLVGKSGLRKGVPVDKAKQIVSTVNNTRIYSGRLSVEAITKDLGTAYTLPDGSVMKDAVGFICSGELDSMFVKSKDAVSQLTDLYDSNYNASWLKGTIGQGQVKLQNLCITILGGSNETNLKNVITSEAVHGGLVARTVMVQEHKKRLSNSLMEKPPGLVDMMQLSDYPKQISKLKGEFKITVEGKLFFDKWYNAFDKEHPEDDTGTLDRLPDTILKVACCISVSRDLGMVIEKKDLQEAIDVCLSCFAGTKRIATGHGKAPFSSQTALILNELVSKPDQTTTRRALLVKFIEDLDYLSLDSILETLKQSNAITILPAGDTLRVTMTKKAYEAYVNYYDKAKDDT